MAELATILGMMLLVMGVIFIAVFTLSGIVQRMATRPFRRRRATPSRPSRTRRRPQSRPDPYHSAAPGPRERRSGRRSRASW